MDKKYLVFSGSVVSRYDGDSHWITARKVGELYKLNPEECVFADPKYPEEYIGYRNQNLIELHPRSDGDYKLHEEETRELSRVRREEIYARRERTKQRTGGMS